MRRFCLAAGCCCLVLLSAANATQEPENELRTWRDASGQHELMGRLVRVDDDNVVLQDREGKQITVALAQLSRRDQQYLQSLVRGDSDDALRSENGTGKNVDVGAGDWPTWRGPNRDGVSTETGLLTQWPEGGPPLLWNADGLGGGYASVSVVGNRVFTMGRENQTDSIIAVDAGNGKILWKCQVGPGSNQQGPNCTPTVDGDRVYGLSLDGELVCARVASGEVIWRRSFAKDFGGKMMSDWGYSESPLIDGDRLLCTPGGQQAMMVALDKMDGSTIWVAPGVGHDGGFGVDGAGYSSIVISHARGIKQYVQLVGAGVISCTEDGTPLWHYGKIANTTANVPTPIVKGDFVFCSTGYNDGGTALLEVIENRGALNVREVYYMPGAQTQNHHGGMVLIDDHVYMGHGHNNGFPLCLELATGKDAWRPGRGAGTGSAALVAADGHLYFRYHNGVMALVEATPQAYRLKSSFQLPVVIRESWPHPVIAGGRLYARDQDRLMCFDVRE